MGPGGSSARRRLTPSAGAVRLAAIVLAASWIPCTAAGQVPPPDSVPPDSTGAPWSAADSSGAISSPQESEREPCSLAEVDPDDVADLVRSKVYRTACGSALWFDNLFRDDRVLNESVTTRGWVQFGGWYEKVGKFEPRFRSQLRVVLPAAERRVHAFIGRDDADALLADSDDRTGRDDLAQREDREDEWLLGLGYTPFNSRLNNFSVGAGASLKWPPDPYVRAQYRYIWEITEVFLARAQQTLFWKESESIGSTTRLDLERTLGDRHLIRWENRGTVSLYRHGLDWRTGLSLFQNLGGPQAMVYRVYSEGLTGLPYNIGDYGVVLTYRRGTLRRWLWIELHTGVSWPRLSPTEDRRINPGAGIMLEVWFP